MDYGRDDEREWRARDERDRPPVGAGEWLFRRDIRELHQQSGDELRDGTDADARRRALIGACLGAVAAGGVAVASSRRA